MKPLYNKKTVVECDDKCENMIGYETIHPQDRKPLKMRMCVLDRKDLLIGGGGKYLRNAKCYELICKEEPSDPEGGL